MQAIAVSRQRNAATCLPLVRTVWERHFAPNLAKKLKDSDMSKTLEDIHFSDRGTIFVIFSVIGGSL